MSEQETILKLQSIAAELEKNDPPLEAGDLREKLLAIEESLRCDWPLSGRFATPVLD